MAVPEASSPLIVDVLELTLVPPVFSVKGFPEGILAKGGVTVKGFVLTPTLSPKLKILELNGSNGLVLKTDVEEAMLDAGVETLGVVTVTL